MLAMSAVVLVVVVHLGVLVYMVLGGFLAVRRFAWIWPHAVTTVYSAYVTLIGLTCPLTTLEKWLLVQAGQEPYQGSFIAHYLHGRLFPAEHETLAWVAMLGVVAVSWTMALRRRRGTPVAA